MTALLAIGLLVVSAGLALPALVRGYRAIHGLEARPWEHRAGPFGAVATAFLGALVVLPAAFGSIELVTSGSLGALRLSLLSCAGLAALSAVVLIFLPGVRPEISRAGPARLTARRARRSLVSLIGGALLCGAVILLA
ncbi:hypothetical protein ACFVQ3_16625 [Oerskovia sp. NPDC057915]|uniref:hypothetical protein n=1 Tax=Oerskovia sp. NPDC057915 TaxID=3346280 RepID=UPI0036DF800C